MIFSILQHECQTRATRARQECDTNDTSATRMRYQRHECDHECYTNNTSATRVKKISFDNDTSENIFSHPYISYIANKRLQ